MKKAFILKNPYSELPYGKYQCERLKSELEGLGVKTDIIALPLGLSIDKNGIISSELNGYDFCIFLDKDKYAAHMLELTGLRLFNCARAIELCDDKMLTHIALSGNGINMPQTTAGLLCYTPAAEIKNSALDKIESAFGYPVIVKESYGSLGKGVYKADNRKQLAALCERVKCTPHLFQKFIKSSKGRDIRVIVIGGKCVAAMQRISNGDFRSNIGLGGAGQPYEIDGSLNDICVRTAKILNLGYCGIDVLFGENGYLVCEVNSNAFFGGVEKATGVNVARAYAEYICGEIYGR
ncbi:MAG: RimK family alpha-L-glutamate ligase [Clostridia bacterium]|nr:RimK family alpha-L-glutamate ligase [Clostridia bacterium]